MVHQISSTSSRRRQQIAARRRRRLYAALPPLYSLPEEEREPRENDSILIQALAIVAIVGGPLAIILNVIRVMWSLSLH